jgi:hypothetical protein
VKQHGLDMLAGAQAVNAEVHAIASKLPLADVPDLNRVVQAAGGFDPKIREDRMAGIQVLNPKILGLRSQPTPVYFVFIRGSPVMKRRHFKLLRRYF